MQISTVNVRCRTSWRSVKLANVAQCAKLDIAECVCPKRQVRLQYNLCFLDFSFSFLPGIMNYSRFLTAVSAARKPSPIRMLSKPQFSNVYFLLVEVCTCTIRLAFVLVMCYFVSPQHSIQCCKENTYTWWDFADFQELLLKHSHFLSPSSVCSRAATALSTLAHLPGRWCSKSQHLSFPVGYHSSEKWGRRGLWWDHDEEGVAVLWILRVKSVC